MVVHHQEPEYQVKQLVCYLQGQGHNESSYDQNVTFFCCFWTDDPFATKLSLMVDHPKPECLDYVVQSQGHSKG